MIILLIKTINSEGTSKSSQTLLFRRHFFKVVCLGSISSVSPVFKGVLQNPLWREIMTTVYAFWKCISAYLQIDARSWKWWMKKKIILLNNYTDLLLIPQIYFFFSHYIQFLLPKMRILCTSSHLTSLTGSYFCLKSWFKCHFLKEACALNSQVNLVPCYIFS